MEIVWATLIVLIMAMLALSVGVIMGKRKIKGSCGGAEKKNDEPCQFCGSKKECEEEKVQDTKDSA